MRRMGLIVVLLTALIADLGTAYADQAPITSYTIDKKGYRIPIPEPYTLDRVIDGTYEESGPFSSPSSLFIDSADNLYVADTGNSRILVFDRRLQLSRTIGKALGLNRPQGIFVTPQGDLYIADTGNARIVHADPTGDKLIAEFKKPQSELLDPKAPFQPSRIVVDPRGYIYVLQQGSTLGIMLLDNAGTFRGYFGSSRVGFDVRRILVSLFATKEQKAQIFLPEPIPDASMYLGADGFLYTAVTTSTSRQIRKLNPVGDDVLEEGLLVEQAPFGELERPAIRPVVGGSPAPVEVEPPEFVDLTVDQYGVISALDRKTGRIYQYDQSRRLLMAIGGLGKAADEYRLPVALTGDSQGRLYVLDKVRNNISRLKPTRFAELVHQASSLYFNGDYQGASRLWQQVLKLDERYDVAHIGIAKAELKQKNYLASMGEFELGEDRLGYSEAFGQYRYVWMRGNFGWLVIGTVAFLVGLAVSRRRVWRRVSRILNGWSETRPSLYAVWGILRSPASTLWDLRERGSLWAVPIILFFAGLVRLLTPSLLAFHMLSTPTMANFWEYLSPYNVLTYYLLPELAPSELNILLEIAHVVVPWLLWVIVSYGVGIIFDGEGSFRALARSSAYCLIPYILFVPPVYLLTRVLTLDSRSLIDILLQAIYFWCAILFFMEAMVVHDFPFWRAVRMVATMLAGMFLLFGFVGLVYLVGTQMVRFAWEVLYEARVI